MLDHSTQTEVLAPRQLARLSTKSTYRATQRKAYDRRQRALKCPPTHTDLMVHSPAKAARSRRPAMTRPRRTGQCAGRLIASFACFTVIASGVGCQSLVQQGLIAPPGPMNYQQANAIIHDPFPQGDLGPEDLASRPPDYQNPLPLPVRNQIKREITPWLGP